MDYVLHQQRLLFDPRASLPCGNGNLQRSLEYGMRSHCLYCTSDFSLLRSHYRDPPRLAALPASENTSCFANAANCILYVAENSSSCKQEESKPTNSSSDTSPVKEQLHIRRRGLGLYSQVHHFLVRVLLAGCRKYCTALYSTNPCFDQSSSAIHSAYTVVQLSMLVDDAPQYMCAAHCRNIP